MIGSKISFFGTYKGQKLWESSGLPFNHPATGETINAVTVDSGSLIVSPEKAVELREEMVVGIKPTEPDGRYRIIQVDTPDKI